MALLATKGKIEGNPATLPTGCTRGESVDGGTPDVDAGPSSLPAADGGGTGISEGDPISVADAGAPANH